MHEISEGLTVLACGTPAPNVIMLHVNSITLPFQEL